jgi:hypothetical protein
MGGATVATEKRTVWLWWGGDCEACLACGGLHYSEPDSKPPLHPNCDCTLGRVELPAALEARLREQFERSLRLVREMNLVAGDCSLSEREGVLLALCRENLDDALRQAAEAGRVEQYHIDWNEWVLTDTERQSSRIKYRLSRKAAEEASGKLERETYSSRALDKAAELHELLSEAAHEFQANPRAVEAAFTDEYGRRKWYKDPLQDRISWYINEKLPSWEVTIPYINKRIVFPDNFNDYGLSNIDYNTALRLQKRYHINTPTDMYLGDYICTEKGCIRFTAAAIREAQDCLADYVNRLPAEMGKVFESLNADEKDALLVTFFKRGLDKEIESLNDQLERIAQKGSKQRYLYLGEGYLAWRLWVRRED